MEQKKFLDASGVKYLYDKLVLDDYPNNDTLSAVIQAIQEALSEKADIDSPTFTGRVKAPTPEVILSDDTVATTAYVSKTLTKPATKYDIGCVKVGSGLDVDDDGNLTLDLRDKMNVISRLMVDTPAAAVSGLAIGSGAISYHDFAVALGTDSITTRTNEVSVGQDKRYRYITYVKDPERACDVATKQYVDNVVAENANKTIYDGNAAESNGVENVHMKCVELGGVMPAGKITAVTSSDINVGTIVSMTFQVGQDNQEFDNIAIKTPRAIVHNAQDVDVECETDYKDGMYVIKIIIKSGSIANGTNISIIL